MPLTLYVYRSDYTCGNRSPFPASLTRVVGLNIPGPTRIEEVGHDEPAVILDTRDFGFGAGPTPTFYPACYVNGDWAKMAESFSFGGRYIASSDSRFAQELRALVPNFYGAVPLHDYSLTREWEDEQARKDAAAAVPS